jgi:hypothetical protein
MKGMIQGRTSYSEQNPGKKQRLGKKWPSENCKHATKNRTKRKKQTKTWDS